MSRFQWGFHRVVVNLALALWFICVFFLSYIEWIFRWVIKKIKRLR